MSSLRLPVLRIVPLAMALCAGRCDDPAPPPPGGNAGEGGASDGGTGGIGSGNGGSSAAGEAGMTVGSGGSGGGEQPGGAPGSGATGGVMGTAGEGEDGGTPGQEGPTGSGGKGGKGGAAGKAAGGSGGRAAGGKAGSAGAAGSAPCEARGIAEDPMFWGIGSGELYAIYPDRDHDELVGLVKREGGGGFNVSSPVLINLDVANVLTLSYAGYWYAGPLIPDTDGSVTVVPHDYTGSSDYTAVFGAYPTLTAAERTVLEAIDLTASQARYENLANMAYVMPDNCDKVVQIRRFDEPATTTDGYGRVNAVMRCYGPVEYKGFEMQFKIGTNMYSTAVIGPALELDGDEFLFGTENDAGEAEYWFTSPYENSANTLWLHGERLRPLRYCQGGKLAEFGVTGVTPKPLPPG